MQIKRLKLTGFKSFVEPVELRIGDGLTGVVGPNGCGKSNLLEALRWAMGEGSPKSLRGGAMDDVIFAGTELRPSRDFAEVSILAESDAANDFDEFGREIEIVRRIERGAGSAYRINGRDVRAKDVALLFADAATGAHSPALVSQGRIGAVIAAKPADRRTMLEEAAGISGLHVRRKDAEQKLRAAETNLERLGTLLADMEARSAALRRQARAAERYRKLSAEIRVAEGRMIFARWREAAAAADAARAEAARAEEAVHAAGEAQRAAAAHQGEAARKLADLRSAAQRAREDASAAAHELSTLKAERAALDRRMADLVQQTERLEADKEREGALANDAAAAIERLGREASALKSRLGALETARPELEARQAKAEAAGRDAEVALAQALAAQARELAETRVADAAMAAASARLERAMADLGRIEAQLGALDDEAPLNTRLSAAKAGLADAEQRAEASHSAIERGEAAQDAATAARDSARNDLAGAQAALSALEAEAAALNKALADTGGQARAIEQVSARPGYERALAAALGEDLEAGIGRDTLRGWRGADAGPGDPALPAGTQPLSDFVKAPTALSRRLSQIGVAERDSGQELAVGQRLVTRDGMLRRWDGFVADNDGAATAERLVRANRLKALESETAKARGAVESAGARAAGALAALDAARAEVHAARQALASAEAGARAAARDIDQAQSALERLTARRGELGERLAEARQNKDAAEAETRSAHAARVALPDGSRTAAEVERLQQAAEMARNAVAQIVAEGQGLDRERSEAQSRLKAAEGEAGDWKQRAGAAAQRIDEITKRARAVQAEALELADAPARLDAQTARREEEVAALNQAAATSATAEREGEAALAEAERRLADVAETLAAAREARAGAVARAENQELRRIEMGRVSGERFECPPPLLPQTAGFAEESVADPSTESAQHERLNADRERLGPVNLVAEQELAEIEGEYARSIAERDELTEAIHRLRGSIGNLNREGRVRLLDAFEKVNGHFQRLFTTLFDGGQAHLALIDSDDPLEAGLEIYAQPPGKKLAAMTLLSGGEQALTAVALIFGLFLTNPAPICVLDEVDAPLDDANIERFCDLLDAMTRETDTRYLIVTHNAVTMSRMHRLYGVTMIEKGVSRLVSVDLGGAEQLLAAE